MTVTDAVILVCGRPGDRGGGTVTETLPRSRSRCQGTKCTPGILKYVIRRSFLPRRKGVELSNTVTAASLSVSDSDSVVALNYLFHLVFPKIVNFLFWLLFLCEWLSVRKKNLVPKELETVRFNSEPKRYKSVSLSAKRP